jgi:hypothetical protein
MRPSYGSYTSGGSYARVDLIVAWRTTRVERTLLSAAFDFAIECSVTPRPSTSLFHVARAPPPAAFALAVGFLRRGFPGENRPAAARRNNLAQRLSAGVACRKMETNPGEGRHKFATIHARCHPKSTTSLPERRNLNCEHVHEQPNNPRSVINSVRCRPVAPVHRTNSRSSRPQIRPRRRRRHRHLLVRLHGHRH